jgi:hypothetical protein
MFNILPGYEDLFTGPFSIHAEPLIKSTEGNKFWRNSTSINYFGMSTNITHLLQK